MGMPSNSSLTGLAGRMRRLLSSLIRSAERLAPLDNLQDALFQIDPEDAAAFGMDLKEVSAPQMLRAPHRTAKLPAAAACRMRTAAPHPHVLHASCGGAMRLRGGHMAERTGRIMDFSNAPIHPFSHSASPLHRNASLAPSG